MILETIEVGGCRSYLLGCEQTYVAALIDPEISAIERYRGIASKHGLAIRYAIDTHTHADHFSAAREIGKALGAQVVMSHLSAAPFVDLRLDDGDLLIVGDLRIQAMATPGHTADSTCLVVNSADGQHVFTGDTLLMGGTGRTDLPTGDPERLYESLFEKLLKLDPATQIHPAHEYKGRTVSTIGEEIATNPRLQKTDRAEFVAMMRALNMQAPTHLTEALRVNMSGKKSVAQFLSEASAAVPFMALVCVAAVGSLLLPSRYGALLALMAVHGADHPALDAGIEWLIANQHTGGQHDGLWHDPGHNAPGFPRVFYMKYYGYDAYFPLWTLARYRQLRARRGA